MTSSSKNSIINFHEQLIKLHGSDKATGFSPVRQAARFDVLMRAIRSLEAQPGHVLDYGCNVGDFMRHLKFIQNDVDKPMLFSYSGIDFNPKFIAVAKGRYADAKFFCADALEPKGAKLLLKLDPNIVVANGVFCYPENKDGHQLLLQRLFDCANSAVIVTFLSREIRTRKITMVRYKADAVIRMARKCGCESFELWHSYLDNDMTLIMRKNYSHDCWHPPA